jgi:molybdate transport system substrate-binding protein
MAPLAWPAFALAAEPIRVFAAASLKTALDAAIETWRTGGGVDVSATYAASSALAKHIEQGAPADLFISADTDWMDELAKGAHIVAASRRELWGNELVLIAAKGSGLHVELERAAGLAELLGDERLAVAETSSVPAGRYAKAALETLGAWEVVKDKLAMAANVRVALTFVARGEAKLGIVYASDARAEPGVEVLVTFPENSHPPIVYPAAIIATSTNPEATNFLAFLASPTVAEIFVAQGFKIRN